MSNARQTLHLSELAGVGHDNRGNQRVTRLLDNLRIELNQSVASSNNIALSNLHAEALTVQVHGIQTNVNQQLNAVLQLQTHSVARGVGCSNLTGCGSNDSGTGRLNRHTLAQLACSENRVRNIRQSNSSTLNRSVQLNDLTSGSSGCSSSGRSSGSSRSSLSGNSLSLRSGLSILSLTLRSVPYSVSLRLVTEQQNTGHSAEERNSQTNHVQVRGLHSRNRQQRSERERVGLNAQEGNGSATNNSGNQNNRDHALVTQHNTVQGRLGNTTEQTGHRRTNSGLAQLAVVLSLNSHTGHNTEHSEVVSTHRGLNEVSTHGLQVVNHDSVQRPVQTQRNHEQVQASNQSTNQSRSLVVNHLQEVRDAHSNTDTDGANQERGHRNQNDDRNHRHEHHLQHRRNNLLQEALKRSQQSNSQQRGEDLTGVAECVQRQIHTEERNVQNLGGGVSQSGQIGEGTGHQCSGDSRTNPHVRAQTLSSGSTQHDRHEVQNRQRSSLQDVPESKLLHPLGVQRLSSLGVSHTSTVNDVNVHALTGQVSVLAEEAQLLQEHNQGQNHRGTQKCPQQRTEGVRQNVEDVGKPARLLALSLNLGVTLSVAGHRRQSVDLVVHSLNAIAQNNLSLAGLLNHRENAGQALNLLVLHCIVRHRSDTKAGCTVSNVRDVLGATQAVKNLLAKFAVIHDTSLDMRSMSMRLLPEAVPT